MGLATALAFVLGLLSAKLCKGDHSVASMQTIIIIALVSLWNKTYIENSRCLHVECKVIS